MKFYAFLFLLFFSFIGCEQNTPIVTEKMVIAPHTVVFAAPDSAKLISITHTCTCPFHWNATILDSSKQWFVLDRNFPSYQQGDRLNTPISIDRSVLTRPSDTIRIQIASNSYGSDTITVVAIK